MKYAVPDAGGSWEHRSGDCARHGVNVPFAKPYHSTELYQCVRCMLRVAHELAIVELEKQLVAAGDRRVSTR